MKYYAENGAGRLVPDLFLFLKNALYEVKASGLQLSFNLYRIAMAHNKNDIKLQTIHPEIFSILFF